MVSCALMIRSHSLASSLDSLMFSSPVSDVSISTLVLLVFFKWKRIFLSLFLYPYFFILRIKASQIQEILSFEFGSVYHMIPGIWRCCRENSVTSEGFPQLQTFQAANSCTLCYDFHTFPFHFRYQCLLWFKFLIVLSQHLCSRSEMLWPNYFKLYTYIDQLTVLGNFAK